MADKQYKRGKTTNKPAKTKPMKTYTTAAGAQQAGEYKDFDKVKRRALNDFTRMSPADFKKKYGKNMFEAIRKISAAENAAYSKRAKDRGDEGGVELGDKFEKDDLKMAKRYKESNMSKGGAVKKYNKGGYANCGASMKATQKSTKMAYGGMARKK